LIDNINHGRNILEKLIKKILINFNFGKLSLLDEILKNCICNDNLLKIFNILKIENILGKVLEQDKALTIFKIIGKIYYKS
jgi:hypothetical protein